MKVRPAGVTILAAAFIILGLLVWLQKSVTKD